MSERKRVISIIAEVLECPPSELRPETRFVEDLGVTSVNLVDVVWRLEEVFGLPETLPSRFQSVLTVEDLVNLVKDTLNEQIDDSEGPLAPPVEGDDASRQFDVAIASDHAGVKLKSVLIEHLRRQKYSVADLGPQVSAPVDYPEYSKRLTDMVSARKARFGVLICGTGVGMSMAANRVPGIRAALVSEPYSAKLARQHNNANVVCIGSRVVGPEIAETCLDAFLTTAFDPGDDGRHRRRLAMFDPAMAVDDDDAEE